MTKLRFGISSAVLAAALTIPFVLQHQSQTKLRQNYAALQQQNVQLAEDNERLSNLVTQATKAQNVAEEQQRELLRLRGQLGVLRRQSSDSERLRQENRRLREGAKSPEEEAPETAAAQDPERVPKESWAFAGYATPQDTLKTLVWAWSSRDADRLLASLTPEARKRFESSFEGKPVAEVLSEFPVDLSKASCYEIRDAKISSNRVDCVVGFDLGFNVGFARDITLVKSGEEWKADW